MARSTAATVDGYLQQLPEDRRAVVSAMRDLIRKHLPPGYDEKMNWGMISYEIPLERYRNTYNGHPLAYIALAAQKNYYALYLMGIYQKGGLDQWLRGEFAKAGKKLDMGKSCLRFRKLEDLPLDLIARVVAGTPPEKYIAAYEASRSGGQATSDE
jgi:hypothetical protein